MTEVEQMQLNQGQEPQQQEVSIDSLLTKKKKKKQAPLAGENQAVKNNEKKVQPQIVDLDSANQNTLKNSNSQSNLEISAQENGQIVSATPADVLSKKKKKKKPITNRFNEDEAEDQQVETQQEESKGQFPWSSSNRDYFYEELLDRTYSQLRANNPELDNKEKMVFQLPKVEREGSKKTALVNFRDLCRSFNRNPNHVMSFLLAELGVEGTVDGNGRLLVKGRFYQNNFEKNLIKYVKEYVSCSFCKSVDTLLDKDQATRLYIMKCQVCKAQRSVAPIKSGFVAKVTKTKDAV